MNLQEFLDFQKNTTKNVMTEKSLAESQIKNYYSGREIKVGDKVLIGIVSEFDPETKLPFTIMNFCEEEVGVVYERDDNFTKDKVGIDLPILKKIQK